MRRLLLRKSLPERQQQLQQEQQQQQQQQQQQHTGRPNSTSHSLNFNAHTSWSPLEFAPGWKDLPCPDIPRRYCAMTMWEEANKMILVGGRDLERRMLDSVEVYDFDRWEWTYLPSLRQPREECVAIVVGTKLYVIGGFRDGSYLVDCEVLDLNKTERGFAPLPNNLPQSLNSPVAVLLEHTIFVLGGKTSGVGDFLDTVYALNTQTLDWDISLPPLKESRQLPTVLIWDEKIVVAGGRACDSEGNVQYLKSVALLNVAHNADDAVDNKDDNNNNNKEWTTLEDMLLPKAAALGFSFDKYLVIAGGEEGDDHLALSFSWYNGSRWAFMPFPAMTELCPGSLLVSLQRQRLVYVDVHREMRYLSFQKTAKPQPSRWEESQRRLTHSLEEQLANFDLSRMSSKALFGGRSPRSIVDHDMESPSPRKKIWAAGPTFSTPPPVSDDPPSTTDSTLKGSHFVSVARRLSGVRRRSSPKVVVVSASNNEKVNEAVRLMNSIDEKEIALKSQPSLELVSDIMDLYRQAIERYEEAGDARHQEIASRMQQFLTLPLVFNLLTNDFTSSDTANDETSTVSNAPDSTEEHQWKDDNVVDKLVKIRMPDDEGTVDEVITSLLDRFDSAKNVGNLVPIPLNDDEEHWG